MKSNKIKTRLMIIIFIILSCTLIFLLSRKENAVEDTTGRGPAMSASFSGSVPSRYSDPWDIEYPKFIFNRLGYRTMRHRTAPSSKNRGQRGGREFW